jgi:hypothetical protein
VAHAPIQRLLRVFGYHWDARDGHPDRAANSEEITMSLHETSSDAVARGRRDSKHAAVAPKRKRPLSAAQEALFFGITFTLAVVLQLAVILKVANVISW